MNLPNTLSLIRLCLVPVFAWAYFLPQPNAHLWAALVYAAAFVTDIADGYIARRFDLVTKLGRILDPLADKLMTLTVITCVTADGILPIWAVVVFFCKEAAMGLGGLYLYRQIKDMPPSNWLGKTSFSSSWAFWCSSPFPDPGLRGSSPWRWRWRWARFYAMPCNVSIW